MNKLRLLPLALIIACAVQSPSEPDDEEDTGASTPPALTPDVYLPPVLGRDGGPVVDQWVPPPPPPDAAPPEPVCTPNQRIALCVVCNSEGQPEVARDDAECPPLSCEGSTTFTLRDEGGVQICEESTYGLQQGIGRCLNVSQCRDPSGLDHCMQNPPREVMRNNTECQTIIGCAGVEPGEVAHAPRGTSCADGAGVCRDNGTCDEEIFEFCAPFNPAPICSRGVNPAPPTGDFCEFDISDGGNCINACSAHQSQCAAAWLGTDECGYGEATGCFTAGAHLICRCVMFD